MNALRSLAFRARLTVAGVLVIASASLPVAGCGSQRRVGCAPVAGDFAVKITPVAGSKTGMGDCDTRFDGAEGVQTMGTQPFFNAPGSPSRINRLAIQPFETGNYALNSQNADPPVSDDGATHNPFAYGSFTTESPDNQDICHVDMWANPAEVQYDKGFKLPPPEMDGGTAADGGEADAGGGTDGGVKDAGSATDAGGSKDAGGGADTGAPMSTDAGGGDGGACPMPEPPGPDQTDFPPLHVKYDFASMRLYVTPALTGSMFGADLTYTSYAGTAACSFKYKVRGVSPSVSCADECGKPSDDLCHADGNGIPQPDWDSEAKNPATRYKNKGAIYTVCDKDSLTCVLDPMDPHIPQ